MSYQVAGEIFRAASKVYYDYWNNALVNNTSGALNYLAKTGAIDREGDVFVTIYPYTIGAKINFGEEDVLRAVEKMVDRTLEFLKEHPKLDIAPNVGPALVDYHDLRDGDRKASMERCVIRNRMAMEMNAEAAWWAEKGAEGRAKKKAQDPGVEGRPPSSPEKKTKNSSENKKNRGRKKKKDGNAKSKDSADGKENVNIAARLSKIHLFD